MNKQRKVLITITYNEMGIIIDTKAEEVTQPNLQPTCNQLAKDICVPCKDTISRQEAIEAIRKCRFVVDAIEKIRGLPSAQPEIINCRDCRHWDKTWTNDWAKDYHYCPVVDGVRKASFYCADAERRTDEQTD